MEKWLYHPNFLRKIYDKNDFFPHKSDYTPPEINKKSFFWYHDDTHNPNTLTAHCTLFWYEDNPKAMLGDFEAHDEESGCQVIENAIEYAKSAKISQIIGPMNGSRLNKYRLFTGNDQDRSKLTFLELFTPLYYQNVFSNTGFKLEETYYSFLNPDTSQSINYSKPFFEKSVKEGFRFRYAREFSYKKFFEIMVQIVSKTFSLEFTKEKFDDAAIKTANAGLKHVYNKDATVILFNDVGQPIGLLLVILDWSKEFHNFRNRMSNLVFLIKSKFGIIKPKPTGLLKTLAIIPKYQNLNLSWGLVYSAEVALRASKITNLYYLLMNDKFKSFRMASKFGPWEKSFGLYKLHIKH